MKVAVMGASGLLGAAVSRECIARGHQLHAFAKRDWAEPKGTYRVTSLPLEDFNYLIRQLFDLWPDAVVNCAAISSPDLVDQNPEFARKINVEVARRLAEISSHLGARYLHVSSDMVFPGQSAPYRSTDKTNPLSEYGQQKLDAEIETLEVSDENLVVLRTTLINGNSPRGNRSPHERILEALSKGKKPVLFTDEWRQTSSADNLAQLIVELLERPNLNGIFHWAGADTVNRYELGRRILQRFGFSEDHIEATTLTDSVEKVGVRPQRLTFELAPLTSKVKTIPASLEQQLEEMHLPQSLYSWYRENVDYPNVYVPRF